MWGSLLVCEGRTLYARDYPFVLRAPGTGLGWALEYRVEY
jgi:hypothetical protein